MSVASIPLLFNLMMAPLRSPKAEGFTPLTWVTFFNWENLLGLFGSKPVSVFPLTLWGLEAIVFSSPSKIQISELSILFLYSLKTGHFSPVLISFLQCFARGSFSCSCHSLLWVEGVALCSTQSLRWLSDARALASPISAKREKENGAGHPGRLLGAWSGSSISSSTPSIPLVRLVITALLNCKGGQGDLILLCPQGERKTRFGECRAATATG